MLRVLMMESLYHILCTVMTFYVRVPVLSEQMHEVEPRVSTDSRFFTSTCFRWSSCAVTAKEMVTHPRRPSGTFATRIPIPKRTQKNTGYFATSAANKKKITPSAIAMTAIMMTNLSSSVLRGLFSFFSVPT